MRQEKGNSAVTKHIHKLLFRTQRHKGTLALLTDNI